MKKIMMALTLCLISVVTFGQLNVQTVQDYAQYKTVYNVKYLGANMGEIRYIKNQGYIVFGVTNNEFEKSMASVFLGTTKESAIKTLEDIKSFYETAETNTYVVDGFKCKTKILIWYSLGSKVIQIESDGVAGKSGILSWFVAKEKHYNGAIESIQTFVED